MSAPPAGQAYFARLGPQRYRPTAHSGGAWNADELHISPVAGLVVHAVERFVAGRPADGMAVARVGIDILGVVTGDDVDVDVAVVRPGRTIELLDAVVVSRSRPAVRARVWRTACADTAAVAGGAGAPLPPPDALAPGTLTDVWPGGYIASLDVRPVRPPTLHRATAWISTAVALVAGEPASDLARLVGLTDTANGISARRTQTTWTWPNVDLTIHLHRRPTGAWLGLDTTVVFGAAGHGVTSSVLHDLDGPVGRAEQVLTLRPVARRSP